MNYFKRYITEQLDYQYNLINEQDNRFDFIINKPNNMVFLSRKNLPNKIILDYLNYSGNTIILEEEWNDNKNFILNNITNEPTLFDYVYVKDEQLFIGINNNLKIYYQIMWSTNNDNCGFFICKENIAETNINFILNNLNLLNISDIQTFIEKKNEVLDILSI